MEFDLKSFFELAKANGNPSELLACNVYTSPLGLQLTEQEALSLITARDTALRQTGRVEFGNGILEKLIAAFYDSPYLSSQTYVETLDNLMEIFYYFKNESLEALSDDALLKNMRQCFDGECRGSVELLAERELENLTRDIRSGVSEGTLAPLRDGFTDGFGDFEEYGGSDWSDPIEPEEEPPADGFILE